MKRILLASLVFCSSCATNSLLVDSEADRYEIYQFLLSYYVDSHHVLGFGERKFNEGTSRNDGILSIRTQWCPNADGFNKNNLTRKIEQLCQDNSGIFMNGWCADKESNNPIFFASAWGGNWNKGELENCSTQEIRLTAHLFNKNLTPSALNIAHKLGFLKPSEYDEKLAESIRKNVETIELQALKRREEIQYMLHNVGTQVCKEKNGVTYVGFVEGVNNKKLKLYLAESQYLLGVSSVKDTKFKPIYIWDIPENWHICGEFSNKSHHSQP